MIRLFAGLALPGEIAAALGARQSGIEGARWRPLGSLHVTLRFFGELREDLARDLDSELLGVSAEAFDLRLAGAGAFGEGADVRAVWAGVGESEALRRLAAACEGAARRVGLEPERRRFRPHVTLAYLRHPSPAEVADWVRANNLLRSPPIRISDFTLFSSRLGGEGSHYRTEATYPLA